MFYCIYMPCMPPFECFTAFICHACRPSNALPHTRTYYVVSFTVFFFNHILPFDTLYAASCQLCFNQYTLLFIHCTVHCTSPTHIPYVIYLVWLLFIIMMGLFHGKDTRWTQLGIEPGISVSLARSPSL